MGHPLMVSQGPLIAEVMITAKRGMRGCEEGAHTKNFKHCSLHACGCFMDMATTKRTLLAFSLVVEVVYFLVKLSRWSQCGMQQLFSSMQQILSRLVRSEPQKQLRNSHRKHTDQTTSDRSGTTPQDANIKFSKHIFGLKRRSWLPIRGNLQPLKPI